jgi:hypothetical protein
MQRVYKLTQNVPSDLFMNIYENFFSTGRNLNFSKVDNDTLLVSTNKDVEIADKDLASIENSVVAFANESFIYDMASSY